MRTFVFASRKRGWAFTIAWSPKGYLGYWQQQRLDDAFIGFVATQQFKGFAPTIMDGALMVIALARVFPHSSSGDEFQS